MHNYLGEIAALGTSFCWATGSIFFTTSSRRIGSTVVNRVRLLIGLLFLGLVHLLIYNKLFPAATHYELFWFGISGITGFVIGDSLLFQSFVLIGPRLGMLMMSLTPVFSTIIAWFFLNEILNLPDIIAIIITLTGVSWVICKGSNRVEKSKHYLIGLIWATTAGFCQALGLIFSKKGLSTGISPLSGNFIRISCACLTIWAYTILRGKGPSIIKKLGDKRAFFGTTIGALLGPFLGVWLSLIAVKYTYVGIASTLMALPPIILIPLSHWVFKEKITLSAIVGTAIAVIGVALIFLF